MGLAPGYPQPLTHAILCEQPKIAIRGSHMSAQTQTHTLSNGLSVILRPVHTAPVVTTWL